MKGFLYSISEIYTRIQRDKVSVYAAQAALFILISILPFILLVMSITGKSGKLSVLSVSAASALLASSKGVMSVISGLDNIQGTARGYVKVRFFSLMYTLLVIVILAFSGIVYIRMRNETVFNTVISAVTLTFVFTLMYKFLPAEKRKFISLIPGSVFSASGWVLFTVLYTVYVKYVADYSVLYGSFSSVVLFILWLYFCMNIFLWGAEINEYLYERRTT